MRSAVAAGLILLGLVLGGCETALQPSTQSRRESGRKAPKLDDRVMFFVFHSESPLKVKDFSGANGSFQFKLDHAGPCFFALATAFTPDGYLLTAGHATSAHVLVIGVMNGEARAVAARIVHKQSFGSYGTDLAILHVDQSIDYFLPLGSLAPGEKEIYAMGSDREAEFKIVVMGGKIGGVSLSASSDQVRLLDTNLPSWHGDSGGAAVSADGKLIGVITGFQTKWSALHTAKLVCAPSKEFVEAMVAADRAKFASPAKSPP